MKKLTVKNCTPHPICIRLEEGDLTLQPSGIIPRVTTIEEDAPGFFMELGYQVPCISQKMGEVQGLPDPEPDTLLVVSALVFGASVRPDLVAPDTGKTCVRDDQGRIVAVTRLIVKEGL